MTLVTQAGYIAIVGRPNVGKSTLLNQLVGAKISIVSNRAQTTRHRISGILTREARQFVFVDTPGFQTRHKNALNRAMNHGVVQALHRVDVVALIVEAGVFAEADQLVLDLIPAEKPVVLVVNKIDRLQDKSSLLPYLAKTGALRNFAASVPISAAKGHQIDGLLDELGRLLPAQEFLFAEDELTDKSERFLAAEYIREKLFRLLGDEVPYGTMVEIEKFETVGRLRRIFAVIVVSRAGHKAIIIGKGGQTLKRIASSAREDMEKLFADKVYLEVWVKVKSGWVDDERLIRSLDYP